MHRIGEDIAERLGSIKREFLTCALFGDHYGTITTALNDLPTVSKIISLSLADPGPGVRLRPQIIGTEEILPLASESLDLAISLLTLQHLNDLPGALAQLKRALKPDGLYISAILGGETLVELRNALLSAEIDARGGAVPRIYPSVDIKDLGALLQRTGFALPVVDSDKLTVTYRSTVHLMHDLRHMGLSNILLEGSGTSLNRRILAKLEENYKSRFPAPNERIKATFEIIYMTGWAPHDSQQVPLKPGSAKTRLADALKTTEFTFKKKNDDLD